MSSRQVRVAKPGETCFCGKPAKAVLVSGMGEVPTCVDPREYGAEVERQYQMLVAPAARNGHKVT